MDEVILKANCVGMRDESNHLQPVCVCVYTSHCLCHKPLEVSRTRLHQHSGGTGSAPASYLPQLSGGCVALGTSTSSGAGGPWYNYQGGYITGTASGHQWAPYPFFCPFVCTCIRLSCY